MLIKSKLKYIQSLRQKKFRQQEGLFIAEGPKLVNDLLTMENNGITEIYALKEWIEENKKIKVACILVEISAIELEKISQLTTPNQVLVLVKQFDSSTVNEPDCKNKIVLALDNIQDPGNMGTIIRIADWYGIDQIICNTECADIYNTKVIQSTMGSIARVGVIYTDLPKWLRLQKDTPVYAAMLDGEDVRSSPKIKEGIIVIGNESRGISEEVLQLVSKKITIPQRARLKESVLKDSSGQAFGQGKAESLNAAVATGIILSHLL